MSIIRVSGSRQGKVNRVYGTSNYIPKPVKKDNKKGKGRSKEEKMYNKIINVSKSFVRSDRYDVFLEQTQIKGRNIGMKTRLNILSAYKDTLSVNGKVVRRKRFEERINTSLPNNLKRYNVPKTIATKILKYEPQYYPHKIVLDNKDFLKVESAEEPSNKKKTTKKDTAKDSYYAKIIRFSYEDNNQDRIDEFIKNINKNEKILSNILIRNIIMAYKQTIEKTDKSRQRENRIKNNLEQNLLRHGIHPEIIKLILQSDPNYN